MATYYSTIVQSGRYPCRGTQTLLQRPVNCRVQVKTVNQGRHSSSMMNIKKTLLVRVNLHNEFKVRTMKTSPGSFSRYDQNIRNFSALTKDIAKRSSRRTVLQLRQNPGINACQTQAFSKKFITDGPGNENNSEESKMTNNVQGRVGEIASVVSQSNSDIIQKVIQAKQKIPPMPKLRLPSFPRFFLAQRAVMSPTQLQEKEVTETHRENIIDKQTGRCEREQLNIDREQHNLEEAMLHTIEEPFVYRVKSNSQSKEAVQRRVITFSKKMEEISKKSEAPSLDDNLLVYRMLAKFAVNLPSLSRLMDVDVRKLIKRSKSSPVEGSDVPLREQHDLEAGLLNMYLSSLPADTVKTLNTDTENVKMTNEKADTPKSKNIMKGILSKAVMNKKEDKELKKPKTKPTRAISQASIDNRTKALVETLTNARSKTSMQTRVENLCNHIMTYPDARYLARKEGVLSPLLRYLQSKDKPLLDEVRKALALLGYSTPVKGHGVKILTIDGGGTRGIVAVEVLRVLEKQCGKPIHEIFDYICAVSSGAVLGFLLSVPKVSLDECESLFYTLTKDVFKRSTLVGTGQLVWNHAYYNTETWTNILRNHSVSESLMIETSTDPSIPKLAALSTLVQPNAIKPYLFRNYNVPNGVNSHYPGSCQYKLWEALRASTAAPLYFEECKLGEAVHQDGGLLCNNPTAIALHECKLLWPTTPIQCIVSLGTGRYVPEANLSSNNTSSLKDKLLHLVMSATDTEVVHKMLSDCMAPGSYFRFNPYLSEDITLDENRMEKIEGLQRDARKYLRRNSFKVGETVKKLNETKNVYHRCKDWLETQKTIRYK